jgi:hypothetical protein
VIAAAFTASTFAEARPMVTKPPMLWP